MSITCLHYPAPAGPADTLLVMLPGAGIAAADFAPNAMIAAVHDLGLAIDITVAAPELDLYLEDGVTEILHEAVIAPALARGCKNIWLLGISLGGMGALLYASARPRDIAGIFLLAPFLGTRGTVAEFTRAGLPGWTAQNSVATAPEQRLLTWLQSHLIVSHPPLIYLGYGMRDRFAPAHAALGAELPAGRVATSQGGQDWPSWTALWRQLLGLAPFGAGRCRAP